ncbi:MAG: amino acid ABC transporter permease [Ardenticatenaceae bacterium]|nr:amino acid ABC transporter permease [Ardenticatenaceae bacterium]
MATISRPAERPRAALDPIKWLRENLFSSWINTLLTFVSLAILWLVASNLLDWIFTQAKWAVVTQNLRLFMVGRYPQAELWRVWICLLAVVFLFGTSWGTWGGIFRSISALLASGLLILALLPFSLQTRAWLVGAVFVLAGGFVLSTRVVRLRGGTVVLAWLLSFPAVIVLLRGLAPTAPLLPAISTSLWGGLLLTLLLAVVGIVAAFPIGILLAIGRRSKLPVVKMFSIVYIEMIRGVPLITILFMSSIMVPLFLPENIRVDRVIRAMVGLVIFSAAYLAENVRGGLQAVPRGQEEAAVALGLSPTLTMGLIILPQALRAVIPAIVGQFISLFKDTSLVAIVGLLELLGIARAVVAQPEFLGLQREVFLFIAAVYWIFSYTMSYASRRLEVALGVGQR